MTVLQTFRDGLLQNYGYLQGRYFALPRSFSDLYGTVIAKLTSFAILPLPFLSFLALPFYGGSTTTFNLIFFTLTWAGIVLSNDPLTIELYGTLAVRLFCFLLPALAFLGFDCVFPNVSRKIKARHEQGLPGRLGRDRLLMVTAVAVGNVLLSVLFQIALEQLSTKVFRVKSLVKVTTVVPLPWTIVTDILKGLAVRGVLHYVVHRYLLHTCNSVLKAWHLQWQHSISVPFSIVAAYDHPVNFLLAEWLPAFAPAYLMRWHVITWHLFLAIVSLEELFIYSGYSALPSTIILAGMARRMEAHFDSVDQKKRIGNFGQIGVIDFVVGTACRAEVTVIDDFKDEAEKRQFQERVNEAVSAALASREDKRKGGSRDDDHDEEWEGETNQQDEGNTQSSSLLKKRGKRKGAKR